MNALQRALVKAGLAQEPKEKKHKFKQFKCFNCGGRMIQIPDTNTMACENCHQYFVFNNTN